MDDIWWRDLFRLGLALVASGAIGLNRELGGRPAGLRTHMLVGMGAALVVMTIGSVGAPADVSRVMQGVVTGIGFLCAGEILHRFRDGQEHVKGLTSAASLWVTAALGMAAGLGQWRTATVGAVLSLVVLIFLRRFEPTRRPTAAGGTAKPPKGLEGPDRRT